MAQKTFIVERGNGQKDKEVKAVRGEQDPGSTRVTFYDEKDQSCGSFINVQGWYEKP